MPSKMFLKLEGISGNSVAPRHFGEIEISGWSFGGGKFQQILALDAQQTNPDRDLRSDLTVTKKPDNASEKLMTACVAGKQFAEVLVTMENTSESGNLLRSMSLKLKAALINSIYKGDGSETVVFNFEKIEILYPEIAR